MANHVSSAVYIIFLLFVLVIGVVSCHGALHSSDEIGNRPGFADETDFEFSGSPAADLQPLMHVRQPIGTDNVAWIGADCATSLLLNSDEVNVQYLWLWGDTLLGNITKDSTRNMEYLVRNSVAVMAIPSTRSITPNDVSFYWGINRYSHNDPDAVFKTMNPIYKQMLYWVASGIPTAKGLVLFAYRMQKDPIATLGVSSNGTTILSISNPHDIPSNWKYTEYHVPNTGKELNFATAVATDTVDPSMIYVVGDFKNVSVLARYHREDMLRQEWSKMEVWARDSKGERAWLSWPVNSSDLEEIGPQESEGSYVYNSYMKLWYTIVLSLYDTHLYIYIADDMRGPWVKHPTPIYTVAPPYNDTGKYFCYAPKSHPELAVNDQEIIITYNCNARISFQQIISDVNLYTPQMVRVEIEVKDDGSVVIVE